MGERILHHMMERFGLQLQQQQQQQQQQNMPDDPAAMYEMTMKKAKQSEQLNRLPPRARCHLDRRELLFQFNMIIKLQFERADEDLVQHRQTFITGTSHCCTTPLDKLRAITLKEMQVPRIHHGTMLACRILTQPNTIVGTEVIVEDVNGDVQMVTFYNFCPNFVDNSTIGWLCAGTILLIKEPFLKFSLDCTSEFIRVDSPSDVVVVHETQRALLSAHNLMCWFKPEQFKVDKLKMLGNDEFKRKNYAAARGYYARALALSAPKEIIAVIHANMSATFLGLKRYSEAKEHAQMAMKDGICREKCLYRLGKAAYGQRLWEEACGHFEAILHEFPDNVETKMIETDLKRAQSRLHESKTGDYDLKAIYDAAVSAGQTHFDLADYIGPVKVVHIPNKGKGLVVTKDVPAGTLLLAEKAYAITHADKAHPENAALFLCLNMLTKEANSYTQVCCIIETIQRLHREPENANRLYALYAGNDMPRNGIEQMPKGVIDTARIERICSMNWFSTTNTPLRTCFERSEDRPALSTGDRKRDEDIFSGTGLWLLTSFINHSCLENTNRVFYGDMLFLYAKCDLKCGDELTLSYQSPREPYEQRAEIFKRKWGFVCECRLCEADRADPRGETKRAHLLAQFKEETGVFREIAANPRRFLGPMLQLVQKLRDSYGDRPMGLRFQMVGPLMALTLIYNRMGETAKFVEMTNEWLESIGALDTLNVYAKLAQTYAHGFRPPKRRMAKQTAKKAFQLGKRIAGIPSRELFAHIYPEFKEFL